MKEAPRSIEAKKRRSTKDRVTYSVGVCGHAFHSSCIEKNLRSCPTCNKPWETEHSFPFSGHCPCGKKCAKSSEEIEARLIKRARLGEAEAQFILGFYYCDGYDCSDDNAAVFNFDPDKGMHLLRSASKRNYIPACMELAHLLFYGSGNFDVACDPAEAFKLLHKVEEADDPRVYNNLASMYGATKNTYRKIMCVKKASDLGDGMARKQLGHLYWGSGQKSREEIREYFAFAAQNSSHHCQGSCHYHIANLYREEGDIERYMLSLKEAAELDHCEAAYLYGSYLFVGIYCEKDEVSGGEWLDQARYLGHPVANFVYLRNFGIRLDLHFHDVDADHMLMMQVAALEESTITDVKLAASKQIWPTGAPVGRYINIALRDSSQAGLLDGGKRLADCSISQGAALIAFVSENEKGQDVHDAHEDVAGVAGAVVLSTQKKRYGNELLGIPGTLEIM